MAYKKLDYSESGIPVNANYLEHLEQGIIDNERAIAQAQFEAAGIDTSWIVSKEEIAEFVSLDDLDREGYAKKSDIPDTSTFLTEVPEEYVTEEELNGKGYLTTVPAEYINEAKLEATLRNKSYVTSTDATSLLSNYATRLEVATSYLTKSEAANTYQPKGDYGSGQPAPLKDGTYNVLSINHRGYWPMAKGGAPENTIPAYVLSKQKGFNFVECDVSFTKDNVAVLLHDDTIDRTSNGSGKISELTYDEIKDLDFSWLNSTQYTDYAGTKIPKLTEFLMYCRGLGLHPYIELKNSGNYTQEQITKVVNEVTACGMKGKVSYISFNDTYLKYVKAVDKTARLGYVTQNTSISTVINKTLALKTGSNDVFLDLNYNTLNNSINNNATNNYITACIDNGLPLEVWTIQQNSTDVIKNLHPYVSGMTSDALIAGEVLEDYYKTTSGVITPDIVVPDPEPEEPEEPDTPVVPDPEPEPDPEPDPEEPTEPTVTYIINTALTNVVLSNSLTTITAGSTYNTSVIVEDGFSISNISVTMAGEDITTTAYANGMITIENVSGDINITIMTTSEVTEDGWVAIKTASYDPAYASTLASQSLKPTYQLDGAASDYANGSNKKRMSYTDFDIRTSPTASYKVKITSNGNDITANFRAGYQWYSQGNIDKYDTKQYLGNIMDSGWIEPANNVHTPTWTTNTKLDNTELLGFRITFADITNKDNQIFGTTTPYKLVIYRKDN